MFDRNPGWRYNQKKKIRLVLHLKAENEFINYYNRSVQRYDEGFRWYKKWLDKEYVERQHQQIIRHKLRNEGKWRMAGERNHWGCGCWSCMKWAYHTDPDDERFDWELKVYHWYGLEMLEDNYEDI